MAKFKEGDRVRIVSRPLTEQDRKVHALFEHMAGLEGTVQNVYGPDEIAVKTDLSSLPKAAAEVHKAATTRMRDRFLENVSEEARKLLSKEELEFVPNYMLLVRAADLEPV